MPKNDNNPKRPRKRAEAPKAAEKQMSENMAASSEQMDRDPKRRRQELQRNMQRSIVTEPLLSEVLQNKKSRHDVIISLNEFYEGGMRKATEIVAEMAREWKTPYTTVSHYVFACLTGERILELAELTHAQVERATREKRSVRTAPTIYRIWKDNDVHMTLT